MTFESWDFYRGMSKKYPSDKPFVKEVRQDRLPRDSSKNFHEAADAWFNKRFGIKYRSQSVFVTSRKLTAQTYALASSQSTEDSVVRVVRVLPLTAYTYCWSPEVSDLRFKAKEMADAEWSAIHEYLDTAGYCGEGLAQAHELGHEVMVNCGSYIAVPIGLLQVSASSGNSNIILLSGA